MVKIRGVNKIVEPQAIIEGAGVHLKRSMGTQSLNYLDPFLLLDHFSSTDPKDYQAGFPLHPHRGIETVTYLKAGEVQHKDSVGHSGTLKAGEVQWMTAGRGILHEEMPLVHPEGISGFQLWVNLPARLKMTDPRYQNITASQIPHLNPAKGVKIQVIAGKVGKVTGPVQGIAAEPIFLDVEIEGGQVWEYNLPPDHNAFAYVYSGQGRFGEDFEGDKPLITAPQLVVFGDGEQIHIEADQSKLCFLLVSGKPLGEPIARYGPFVMNTREEIEETLRELREGSFAKQ